MKLTALLLLGACLNVHAIGFGQKISLSEREAPIEKVFREIEGQSNYKFLYASHVIKDAKKVTLTIRDASIEAVLDLVFSGQNFGYRIDQNTVVVKPRINIDNKPNSVGVTSDPIDVRGIVTDNEGRPLPGANVKIKGSSVGTTTDNEGRFSLRNVVEGSVLEISFVGYEQKTFTVRGSGMVNIALGQKLSLLDETIVIAYGTTSRRFTTGNVSSLKAVDIEKQPVQNPLLALQGRVPGVEVTQLTGLNGGGVQVRIQGRNSLFSGLDPLVVIDGVPYPTQLAHSDDLENILQGGSPLNFINPADIESIDILKDADATAIYGSRAANGAILITTKKGKAGRSKINLSIQQGLGKVTRKLDMMNTRQYLDMRYEAFRNNAFIITPTPTPDYTNYDLTLWDTTRYTNWQRTLIGGTARYTTVNGGISGGNSVVQYLFGGSYNRRTTVFPGSFDDKSGGVHLNINGASANEKLKLQLNTSYSYDQNHLPGVDLTRQAVLLEPDAPALYTSNGTLNWASDPAGKSSWANPLAYTQASDFKNTTKNLTTHANISYHILPGLEVSSSVGYTNMQADIYNPFRLEVSPPELRATSQRTVSVANRNMSSWLIEPQLQYTGKIAKGKIEGLLATSIQKSTFSYLSLLASGFSSDLLMKTLQAANSTTVRASHIGVTRFNALFGRLGYNWNGKYLININARRDGSNKFGDKNKFHNFASIGGGWIFSEENWITKKLSFLSFGKLRVSYGTTGNDQLISDFQYESVYYLNTPSVFYAGSAGLYPTNIPNPHLQWEETRKWQGGIDLGFMHDRIMLGVTYARNRSSNQLVSYVLPALTGFNNIFKNLPALIQNTSWEFTLNTINLKTSHFSWNSSFNITIPSNKLVNFPGIESTPYASGNYGFIVGQPLGILKAVQYMGINPANGLYTVMDKNGNPNTGSPILDDMNVLISTLSKFYGGMQNSVSYKKFQLDFLFQFVRKRGPRDMIYYNGFKTPGNFAQGFSNQPVSVLDRWKKPGDNAAVGRFTTSVLPMTIVNSDAWYSYDASYIRLKNLSVSWQLPTAWTRKAKLQNARFFMNCQNLATISNYKGLDPETMSITTLPPLRVIMVGGQIEF